MPGLIRGVAGTAVVAGTATAVSNRVSRRQAGRWADQEQQAYEQQYQQAPPQYQQVPPQYRQPVYQEPPPAPPPPPAQVVALVQQPAEQPAPDQDMSAKLAQLQQLGELNTQGILTDAEFEVQKQRILNS
jgi:ABC-type nitrate/sulfonate/bicarbonate transport system substrate-binding protein